MVAVTVARQQEKNAASGLDTRSTGNEAMSAVSNIVPIESAKVARRPGETSRGAFAASMTRDEKSNRREVCRCVTTLDKNSANVALQHASND